jgi:acetyl-CoA carboxylase/biotin carboxylase 1
MGVPDGTTNGHGGSRAAKHNLPSHFIGGNHLDAAAPSSVKDFVANHEGHSVITSVSLPATVEEEFGGGRTGD